MKWAGPKGLLNTPNLRAVTIYHDDPKVTEISKVRQSACIILDKEIKPEGEFGYTTIPEGKFAVGSFKIDQSEFETAWNSMCVWVTENGYSFRDGDYFEIYYNDCKEAVKDKFIVDICIPVE